MVPAIVTPAPNLPAVPVLGDTELLAAFLASLSANTRAAYDGDLADYARHRALTSPQAAVIELLSAGPGNANLRALEYRTALQARGLAPSTIARRLAALRSMVRMARTLGRIVWTLDVRSPKIESYRDTAGPGRDGWRAFRAAAERRCDSKGCRDLALIRLLHDLALRRAEAITLDVSHVDRAAAEAAEPGELATPGPPLAVWILGKGRRDRERIELPPQTSAALEAWLRLRGPWPGPVFPRLDRPGSVDRLTGRSVARIVGSLGMIAALPRPVRPHGLRHAAITAALDRTGGDVRKVQRFSRHVNIQTLIRYDDRRTDPSTDIARLVADDSS